MSVAFVKYATSLNNILDLLVVYGERDVYDISIIKFFMMHIELFIIFLIVSKKKKLAHGK